MARPRPSTHPAQATEPASPRAKKLAPKSPDAPSAALLRACDSYRDAALAFDAVCDERGGVSQIDERYADLAHRAAEVVSAVLDDRRRWASGDLEQAVAPYVRRERAIGVEPDDDVQLAERVRRELGNARRASS